MTHYLMSEDGKFRFHVDMGCAHPEAEGNTCPIGGGDCGSCPHCEAIIKTKDMMELLKRADCNHISR